MSRPIGQETYLILRVSSAETFTREILAMNDSPLAEFARRHLITAKSVYSL